ncbi:uncharacterized protein MONBRDRAFT_32358 [Monosiga brevicollis MX1]|uniref:CCHC-type domain-containing protein n=1 Tax=Monosiga brevicollis TaxID=81824 RepID=A9UZ15_MONBE|nr:uncharacterized protein MONBRDRAFT_32358 [Monosiga brevicollis MX1]EDQ89554.1 predicted protein [Monosiga brevicollis MX1]|eukprot:XP_001745583.1 hypothetical protein [Monosiga brevicollis MX1]
MGRQGRMKKSKVNEASAWDELKPEAEAPRRGANADEGGKRVRSQTDAAKAKRREHRRQRRLRMKARDLTCFGCRQRGHTLETCPASQTGICFRCGSTEHTTAKCTVKVPAGQPQFPYATCFICKGKGHLSRECPDNPKGLYPDGGGCGFCGSVEHFKRDCPDRKTQASKGKPKLRLLMEAGGGSVDADDSLVLDHGTDDESESDEELSSRDQRTTGRPAAPVNKRAKTVKF